MFEDLGFSKVDILREKVKGFPEIVYGLHKTPQQILEISKAIMQANQKLLITRLDKEKWQTICKQLPEGVYDEIGQTYTVSQCQPMNKGRIVIVSAGTSDDKVVFEAYQTLKWMGCRVEIIQDVGVAGLSRLLSYLEELRQANVIIVVAGMEGALPSVVSGLVESPVIAVPTSVGYGSNLDGLTTLLAMATSCSSGISVVNIDNGFGAAYQAALFIKQLNREES